jgi:hypothetical protein
MPMPPHPPNRSAIYRTVALAVGGDVYAWLSERRQRGDSFEDIAVELRGRGIVLTGETVRTWCSRLGVPQAS